MREHKELLNKITEIENKLAAIVTDKVSTPHGVVEWKRSTRYDNEAIVAYLETNGQLDPDLKNQFITYDNTGIVNYFKLDQEIKKPFAIIGDRKLSITHKKI